MEKMDFEGANAQGSFPNLKEAYSKNWDLCSIFLMDHLCDLKDDEKLDQVAKISLDLLEIALGWLAKLDLLEVLDVQTKGFSEDDKGEPITREIKYSLQAKDSIKAEDPEEDDDAEFHVEGARYGVKIIVEDSPYTD